PGSGGGPPTRPSGPAAPGADAGLLSVRRGDDLALTVPLPDGAAGRGPAGPLDRIRTARRRRSVVLGPAVARADAWRFHGCAGAPAAALDCRTAVGAGIRGGSGRGRHGATGVFLRGLVLAEERPGPGGPLPRAAPVGRLLAARAPPPARSRRPAEPTGSPRPRRRC
ncbi:hypothetical protein ACFWDW_35160, partial [Streptomyces roseolus]